MSKTFWLALQRSGGVLGVLLLVAGNAVASVPNTQNLVKLTQSNSQLAPAGVKPTDWQFQTLQSFFLRYNCVPLPNKVLTRYELAVAMNNCQVVIKQFTTANPDYNFTPEEIVNWQKLEREFAVELAQIRQNQASGNNNIAPRPPAPAVQVTPRPVPPPVGSVYPLDESSGGGNANFVTREDSPQQILINPGVSSDPDFNREGYRVFNENTFQRATNNPLSTFSIDVDRASYSNVRRFISNGQRPPKDAVRIEELINYFTYNYPQPSDDKPFSITTELASAPWNPKHKLVKIGLQGKRISTEDLPPSNLVFLVDVSGSMDEPNKLPLVKSSLGLLVNELREEDRVTIVVYAGAAGVVLPATSGNQKEKIMAAIENLKAGGSTAGGEGINLAYKWAEENFIDGGNNRVILATDGDFNVGVSSDAELVRLIEEKRNSGVFLSVLGFGTGNYQDAKMEQLANQGNGNYAYVDSLLEAKKVLVKEIGATLLTIAKDVKIQVEFNPAKVQAYRLIGYENRLLQAQDFNDDQKDSGELGAGHSVTALYEIIPVGIQSDVKLPEVDPLRYQQNNVEPVSQSNELMQVKLRYKAPNETVSQLISQPVMDGDVSLASASSNLKFAAAVAGFGMILRESEHKGSANFDQVLQLAIQATDDDPEGYRGEFIRLVEKCRLLPDFQK
ncbi:von Willebrand factor type A domain-containing protein [Ancylothrix sp. C2]|uniref:vWA domain-containing protein n=1 Tax=Ancylothrix sp. D3o TaxID=2953691 RepID=UPI0021BB72B5|nr:VWA domain-containing protein [Ancylothrix sp. D3o]MCT7949857.1 von Willebrand factor type A domain-containing protein [Ancylothrix sp. D3o]